MSSFKWKRKFGRSKIKPFDQVTREYGDVCAYIGDKEFQIKCLQKELSKLYTTAGQLMEVVQAHKIKESQMSQPETSIPAESSTPK